MTSGAALAPQIGSVRPGTPYYRGLRGSAIRTAFDPMREAHSALSAEFVIWARRSTTAMLFRHLLSNLLRGKQAYITKSYTLNLCKSKRSLTF